MLVTHELSPIYNENSKILILGSIPSVKSREVGFYYAHPSNRFWKILENLFNEELLTPKEKTEFLLKKHIALWDVFKSCDIHASSDASIKNYELNDIDLIIKSSPIKAIFCTGKTAYNNLIKNYNTTIPIISLPSPSSANATWSIEKLTKEYSIILEYLK